MPRSDPSPRDPLVGTRIDNRYTVRGTLGRGGMGVVYDGVHDELGRHVAIKVLNAAWAADPNAVARFLREARTAGSLSHGNIVDVSDLGRLPDGRPYLVMPKVSGTDLAELLRKKGRQPPKRVAELLTGAAAALDLIHAKGLVHRDIKPENLMYVVREDGSETVMLLDFGIAALVASNEPRLTRQGAIFGTPEYLPPEVWDGKLPDGRGDVYALATVAFELMTGELPFMAENVMQILPMKLKTNAPRMSYISGVRFPDVIEEVVARGLARDPNDRYRSASELVSALRAATADAPISWRPGDMKTSTPADDDAADRLSTLEEPLFELPASADLALSTRYDDAKTFLDVPRPISVHPPTRPEAIDERAGVDDEEPVTGSTDAVGSRELAPRFANVQPTPATTGSTELPVGAARRYLPHALAGAALLVLLAWFGLRSSPPPLATIEHEVNPAPVASAAQPPAPEPPPPEQLPVAVDTPREETAAAKPSAAHAAAPATSSHKALASKPALRAEPEAKRPASLVTAASTKPTEPVPASKNESHQSVATKPTRDPAAAAELTRQGTAALLSGQVAHAAELLRRALAADPGHAPAYRSLGLALERTGDTRQALDAYEHYLKLDPHGAQADKIRERLSALKK